MKNFLKVMTYTLGLMLTISGISAVTMEGNQSIAALGDKVSELASKVEEYNTQVKTDIEKLRTALSEFKTEDVQELLKTAREIQANAEKLDLDNKILALKTEFKEGIADFNTSVDDQVSTLRQTLIEELTRSEAAVKAMLEQEINVTETELKGEITKIATDTDARLDTVEVEVKDLKSDVETVENLANNTNDELDTLQKTIEQTGTPVTPAITHVEQPKPEEHPLEQAPVKQPTEQPIVPAAAATIPAATTVTAPATEQVKKTGRAARIERKTRGARAKEQVAGEKPSARSSRSTRGARGEKTTSAATTRTVGRRGARQETKRDAGASSARGTRGARAASRGTEQKASERGTSRRASKRAERGSTGRAGRTGEERGKANVARASRTRGARATRGGTQQAAQPTEVQPTPITTTDATPETLNMPEQPQ